MGVECQYPKRPPFFSNRFLRLLGKTCVANEIGSEACWLLAVVAMTEDSKKYTGPVTFFNHQLMPFAGIGSEMTLARVRRRAVDAGWLHYEPGGKGVAGRYWVVVPPQYTRLDDGPADENPAEYTPPPAPPPPPPVPPPPPAQSAAVAIDPLREAERRRKEFESAWNAAGLRKLDRLTHSLHSRLAQLLGDEWWAASWREALTRAGQNPYLAQGVNRRQGPLDPSEFLRDDDFVRQVLAGKFDPRPPPVKADDRRRHTHTRGVDVHTDADAGGQSDYG